MSIYMYMYRECLAGILILWSYTRCMSKFRVGDNRRTVNTPTRLGESTKFWSVGDRKRELNTVFGDLWVLVCDNIIDMNVILDLILKYNEAEKF